MKNPGFNNDIIPHINFIPLQVTSDDIAYSITQAACIVDWLGHERAAELGIDEEDNPVIMKVKLKR